MCICYSEIDKAIESDEFNFCIYIPHLKLFRSDLRPDNHRSHTDHTHTHVYITHTHTGTQNLHIKHL